MTQDAQEPAAQDPALLGGDLAGLMSEVDALEGAQAVKVAEQQADQAQNEVATAAAELLDALKLLRSMAAPTMAWWASFMTVWSDNALQAIADNGAVVMQRHGWTMGEVWAQLGPYIALVAALVPPSLTTWQAIQQRKAELARQQPQQAQQPPAPAPVMP